MAALTVHENQRVIRIEPAQRGDLHAFALLSLIPGDVGIGRVKFIERIAQILLTCTRQIFGCDDVDR
jgi:hypothetical protein